VISLGKPEIIWRHFQAKVPLLHYFPGIRLPDTASVGAERLFNEHLPDGKAVSVDVMRFFFKREMACFRFAAGNACDVEIIDYH
jgi:hypothetical protein